MKKYIAYVRVSTIKQGEKGVSLTEQKSAITRYAEKHGLSVMEWFEETETAAKEGRRKFQKMLKLLKDRRAHGVIMHKVDRGARNLKDWAEINSLMDIGVDIHFAHEAIDLNTRGGRLSADIQAVVAADYIRNLKEEVIKGMSGRLNQGILPWHAPAGYLDNGGGNLKTIDPDQGHLVTQAFKLYATGEYSLRRLRAHMEALGLRGQRSKKPVSLNGLHTILRNPFYMGVITTRQASCVGRGESYIGQHQPLIDRAVFEKVQSLLTKKPPRTDVHTHKYTYRRLIECKNCKRHLYAEIQKGRVYYRCQSETCKGTSIRERDIEFHIGHSIEPIFSMPWVYELLSHAFHKKLESQNQLDEKEKQSATLQLRFLASRLDRLTDTFLDGSLSQEEYLSRKSALLKEKVSLQEITQRPVASNPYEHRVENYLELTKTLVRMPNFEKSPTFQSLAKKAVSNLQVFQKNIEITWHPSISLLFENQLSCIGAPYNDTNPRVCDEKQTEAILDEIFNLVVNDPIFDETLLPDGIENCGFEKCRTSDT